MKKKILSYLLIVLVLAGILFTSCTNFNGTVTPTLLDSKDTEQTFITDLVVGSEKQEIGNVSVNYDEENIYVTYHITEDGWELLKTNLYIGIEPLSNSSPGQFPFSKEISDSQHLDEYVIPYTEITNFSFGDILYFAAYAEVKKDSDTEGAWGSGIEINPGMNWAMYFSVKIPFDDSYSGVVDIPETTKILDGDTISKITYISDDMSLIEFDHPTPQLNQLNIGDIIVMGVTEYTPEGLLRKVKKVTKAGGKVIIETEFGTLEEAIEDGEFYFDISLQPEDIEESLSRTAGIRPMTNKSLLRDSSYDFNYEIDVLAYDGDGIPETLEDNVTLLGNLSFDYNLIFSAKIADHELKNLTFKNIIEIGEGININVGGSLTVKLLGKSLLKKPIRLKPITFTIGPLPVVLIPIFDLKWSIDGGIYGTLTTEVARTDTFTVGFEWSNGTAQPIADHHTEYDSSLTSSAGFTIKGSVGPELFCKIYGVAGPYCTVGPYIKGTGDKYANPWWELKGGLHVLAGAKLEIFRITYAEVHLTVLDVSKTILQADGPFPNYAPIITSLVADSDTLQANESTTITCFASDPDGDTITYDWSSPDGGTISGSGSTITWTAPSTEGNYTIVCEVSDGKASDSASVNIIVSETNHPPTIDSTSITVATKDEPYIYDVEANDLDGDSLTYSLTTKPDGMNINPSTGLITWTPSATGDFNVNVRVSDGELFDTQSYTITVYSVAPETHTITASAGLNGSIDPSGEITVNQGLDQSFTMTPDTGYQIEDVSVDGISIGTVSNYTFTNVTEDHTIAATFSLSSGTGSVYYVPKDFDTIQAAINNAVNGDTIIVSIGIYYENINFSGKNITLRSTNPDDPSVVASTIIDGGMDDNVVTFWSGETQQAVLSGFTIQNGSSVWGGGIEVWESSPTIIGNTITGNKATSGGGGIDLTNSSPTIIGNIITNNEAIGFGEGGGIYLTWHSAPIIENNNIHSNFAFSGGGIFMTVSSAPIIKNNTISNNMAFTEGGGGGIYIENSSPTIGGTDSSDTGNYNTFDFNIPDHIYPNPDAYPYNYFF